MDTSFLPDREREKGMRDQREKLKKEWIEEQEKLKSECFSNAVTFSVRKVCSESLLRSRVTCGEVRSRTSGR